MIDREQRLEDWKASDEKDDGGAVMRDANERIEYNYVVAWHA